MLNGRPSTKDNPRSEPYYAINYGTAKKFRNYLKVKREYKALRTSVASFPYTLRIEPVSACNLKCPLCPTGSGHFERGASRMTEATYEALLDEVGDYLFFVRMYIWGEPLLARNLWKLIAMTTERGIGSEVSTNLSVPLSSESVDRLIQAGLSWMIISIDAASAQTYGVYRRGGDFDLVLANTRKIAARKRELGAKTPYLEWQFIPMRHNEQEMDKVVALARENGADGVRFKLLRMDKPGQDAIPGEASPDVEADWTPSTSGYHSGPAYHDFTCPFLWGHGTVHSDGGIASCCETHLPQHDVGNLAQGSFMEQWRGPRFQQLRRAAVGDFREIGDEATVCASCTVFAKPLAGARATTDGQA